MAPHHGATPAGTVGAGGRRRVPDALAADSGRRPKASPRLPGAVSHVHVGARPGVSAASLRTPSVPRAALAAVRARRPAAGGRLCNGRQPAARVHGGAPARAGRPPRARRRTPADCAAALRRGRPARGRRRALGLLFSSWAAELLVGLLSTSYKLVIVDVTPDAACLGSPRRRCGGGDWLHDRANRAGLPHRSRSDARGGSRQTGGVRHARLAARSSWYRSPFR